MRRSSDLINRRHRSSFIGNLNFPEDLMKAVRANSAIRLAPYFVGSFDEMKRNVGTGEVSAYNCGGKIRVQIACNHNHQIIDAKFQISNCATKYSYDGKPFPNDWAIQRHIHPFICDLITFSQYNLLTTEIHTTSRTTYAKLKNSDEIKINCVDISNEAILLAIENYRNKNRE